MISSFGLVLGAVTWICSSGEVPWQRMPGPALEKSDPNRLRSVRMVVGTAAFEVNLPAQSVNTFVLPSPAEGN